MWRMTWRATYARPCLKGFRKRAVGYGSAREAGFYPHSIPSDSRLVHALLSASGLDEQNIFQLNIGRFVSKRLVEPMNGAT
jgi:hypothetical protein